MDVDLLERFGLSRQQARTYICLIKSGSLSAKKLAEKIKESRTNVYMILNKLIDLGLVQSNQAGKVSHYFPASPTQLEKLILAQRTQVLADEKAIKEAMPTLLNYFYTYQHTPGIRFFQGIDGIAQMYDDQQRTGAEIHYLNSGGAVDHLHYIRNAHIEKRAKLNIHSHIIEEDSLEHRRFAKENDTRLKRSTTWIPAYLFNAPVDIYAYGSKVALISYGEETIGTIIESPQIAHAFKQILNVVRLAAPLLAKEDKIKGSVEKMLKNLPATT